MKRIRGAVGLLAWTASVLVLSGPASAAGSVAAADNTSGFVGSGTETVVVTGTKFNAESVPAKASLNTTEPQTIINKLYIDMDWDLVNAGDYIIAEAYQVVNPDIYTRAWADRWLLRYGTCLIKKQWGENLKKFIGMKLPGGVMFNGQNIYQEAEAEQKKLEDEMIYTYSLPATDMIG